MTNKNDKLVVGLFESEKKAKDAARSLKDWDAFDDSVKLGAMAALTYNERKNKLHADEIGERQTRRGLGWGTAIGAAVGILSGGIGLIPGLVVGGAVGAGAGALNHKSVGLTDAQYENLVAALKEGGSALAVMCDDFEVDPLVAKMAEFGGDVSHYTLEEAVAEAVTAAAAAQVAASEAIDETVEEIKEEEIAETAAAIEAAAPELDEDVNAAVAKMVVVTDMSVEEATSLYNVGIEKTSDLLELVATPDGRAAVSEASGLDPDVVLYYAKKLDLMRVKGVGHKYATLLLAAGVDTVPELASRNAANLAAKLDEVNAAENIVETVPSEKVVSGWVDQAKDLPRMIEY